VPYFSERHRVVTIDLAGHGESGLGREVWSMRAFGQDVAAVVEELGLEQIVLVGHSMGGPVIVEAALILGDRVKVVVGADTFGDVSARYTEEFRDNLLRTFRADFEAAMSDFVRPMFVPNSDSALIERIVDDLSAAPPDVALGAAEVSINWLNNELAAAFGELRVPVRAINSDRSPTNVDAGREYTSSFDVLPMSGVGHFVMMEDPSTFNRLLSEIVEGLPED
jgi:pimeloyl-ACP methyl ester carboxylesterase